MKTEKEIRERIKELEVNRLKAIGNKMYDDAHECTYQITALKWVLNEEGMKGAIKCDSCGREFSGKKYEMVDENFNKTGAFHCGCVYEEVVENPNQTLWSTFFSDWQKFDLKQRADGVEHLTDMFTFAVNNFKGPDRK